MFCKPSKKFNLYFENSLYSSEEAYEHNVMKEIDILSRILSKRKPVFVGGFIQGTCLESQFQKDSGFCTRIISFGLCVKSIWSFQAMPSNLLAPPTVISDSRSSPRPSSDRQEASGYRSLLGTRNESVTNFTTTSFVEGDTLLTVHLGDES